MADSKSVSMFLGINAARRKSILLADPQFTADSKLVQSLLREDHDVVLAGCLSAANLVAIERTLDYAIVELRFDDGSGFDLVGKIAAESPECRILVHTAYCDVRTAVQAVKLGAADVCPKPMDNDHLIGILMQKCKDTSPELHQFKMPNQVRAEHIRQVFLSCGSNISRTAKHLSLQRRTLQRIMARHPNLRSKRS